MSAGLDRRHPFCRCPTGERVPETAPIGTNRGQPCRLVRRKTDWMAPWRKAHDRHFSETTASLNAYSLAIGRRHATIRTTIAPRYRTRSGTSRSVSRLDAETPGQIGSANRPARSVLICLPARIPRRAASLELRDCPSRSARGLFSAASGHPGPTTPIPGRDTAWG